MFEINKGKTVKPATPSKAAKEPEKQKEEQAEEQEKPIIEINESSSQEDLNSTINEDELILKDEYSEDIDTSDDKINASQEQKDDEQPKETTEDESSKDRGSTVLSRDDRKK